MIRPSVQIATWSLLAGIGSTRLAAAQPTEPAPVEPPALTAVAPPTTETLDQRLSSLMGRPGGLTSKEVGERAAASHPEVRAKQAEIAAAEAELDKAYVGYFPRLTLTARYVRLSPIEQGSFGPGTGNLVATPAGEGPLPPGTPLIGVPASALSFPAILDQRTLQATLTVPISDYLLNKTQTYAAASQGKAAAELQARATRLSVAANARLAYYGWARSRLQQEIAHQSLSQARTHLEAVKALREVDRASKADVLRAESAIASAELLVERAQNLTLLNEDRLRTLLRDPPSKKYQIGEDLMGGAGNGSEPGGFPTLYAEALRRRLELAALDKTQSSLREQKKATSSLGYPRLDAFGNAYYANPNSRYVPQREEWKASWDVGVQLTWTPNDLGVASATSAALDAQRARIEAQKEQLRDALRAEIFESLQALREARVATETSRRGLTAAEEAYRVRAEQFRWGRATSIEVTDAEAELLRARLETVNARVALRVARVRLDHALGRDARGK